VIAVGGVRKTFVGAIATCVVIICLVGAAGAAATTPWWQLDSLSMPTNMNPGGTGALIVSASNLGEAPIEGPAAKVTLRDTLPAGLVAKSVSGFGNAFKGHGEETKCTVASGSLVECTFEGTLAPYERLEIKIEVEVRANAQSGELNDVAVSGGGAMAASLKRPIVVGDGPTQYGVANFEQSAFEESGSLDTQAGSHPYGLTTTVDLNRTAGAPYQPALPKDLNIALPPGLIGNPTPFPQCSDSQFTEKRAVLEFVNKCPADTAVGVASITIYEPEFGGSGLLTVTTPVFNLKPSTGEPARFGFQTLPAHVILDTSVRTGGDYGVTVSADNITQISTFLGSQVTFWGVPGDPIHDQSRGWECLDGGFWGLFFEPSRPCNAAGETAPPPLLSLPTSCTGPLRTTVQADSWAHEGSFTAPLSSSIEPSLDGCNRLPFNPSISVTPDGQAASSPTGLTVGIHLPQDALLSPSGLAESNVKSTTVVLPAGVALNPAAADGLEACSEGQVALSQNVAPACPEASKVATVEIKTPLLPNALTGEVYLAQQNANPFGSLVALYLVAQDPVSGTLVKLAGEVKLDPVTGQLVSTFDNTPQLPFEDLSLHFFGGDRAPLATPASCGVYTTMASIGPWSGNEAAAPSSTFDILSGQNGTPCPGSTLPFAPSLTAGTTNIQAGGLTPFTMTVTREDGQQDLKSIELHMPPGLSGLLTGIKLCGEAEADAGTCRAESLIGETTVSVGLGGDPFSVTGGKVYITGPYEGAPFGVSIVVPAKAGPYDLGQVVVRGRIEVDPITSALTVTTDSSGPYAIPHILDGIPLQIKHVNFTTTRADFTFNPTNCDRMNITGGMTSVEGAGSALSVPFQVTNCAVLGFKPGFHVSTSGKTSRAKGASLSVTLTYPKAAFGSQANIKSVKVDLPKQLPSRLTTLQKACTAAQFQANPAGCPPASMVGHATAITPLIPVPLTGPAYFVSYGGAKFPELVIVLQGYGVTLALHGETFINKVGITSSTFHTVPDAPVGSFELTLPQGPFSALAANGNLCKSMLKMPTAFVAQNGATIKQSTPVGVTGCAKKVKAKKNAGKRHKGNSHGTR
jgi:uncharacterized repeat protein (TIGR01451 family)